MSDMSGASNLDVQDICSALLLLSTAFDDDDSLPFKNLTATSPKGVQYSSPRLDSQFRIDEMPWRLVRAALWQMYANLFLLCESDEPELVHQARVGWRRLRGTSRLLRSVCHLPTPPQVGPLRSLIAQLREIRDNDVVRHQVLPRVAELIPDRIAPNGRHWRQLCAAIEADAAAHRDVLRTLLEDAAIGESLWTHVLWLLQLRDFAYQAPSRARDKESLQDWARHRIRRIYRKFERAQSRCRDEESRHRARIWAKRLRYATEDFSALLPDAAKKWHKMAIEVQSRLGDQRDLQTAVALAEKYGATQIASEISRLSPELLKIHS